MELQMVMMPNFLTIKMPPRPRQDGYVSSPTIPVSDLTAEQAEQYATHMKEAFMEHWKAKKQNHNPQ